MTPEFVRHRIDTLRQAEADIALVQAGHDSRRVDSRSFALAAAALRQQSEGLQGSFTLQVGPRAVEVGRLGELPAVFTPTRVEWHACCALGAALAAPRRHIDMWTAIQAEGNPPRANTLRTQIDGAVRRLDAVCPGIGALLALRRGARRGTSPGISVFSAHDRVYLVYSPTVGRHINMKLV